MAKPLLHRVFGGEVRDPRETEFADVANLGIVGIFPSEDSALKARRGANQRRVDQAGIKFGIVHLHRLLDPGRDEPA